MSHKQAKKKRPSGMFNFDEVKARVQSKNDYINDVRERINALKEVDLGRLKSDGCKLSEDEALQLLASKVSVEGVFNLRRAIKHVPENITRMVNGTSLRSTLIFKTFKSLASPSVIQNLTNLEDVSLYTDFAESYCSSFLCVKETDDNLWGLTEDEDFPFNKFLTPPVSFCMQCEKKISMRNNPSRAKLFTLNGPVCCSKVTLECRDCRHIYGICNYSDALGTHFYPSDMNIELVEVSNVTYFDLRLYKWFPCLSNHCWVSFSGFAESYNDVYEKEIERYASCILEDASMQDKETSDMNIGVLPGEMSGKVIAKCFWHQEVEEELLAHDLREQWIFTSEKCAPMSGTYDDAMEFIDKKRSDELYLHSCSDHCKQKGCGQLYVADGNWKLRYAHCMWKVPVSIPGFGKVNYPSICPLSPKRGHAFCPTHCEKGQALGYPTELRAFFKKCGVDGKDIDQAVGEMSSESLLTDASLQSVSNCLDEFASNCQDESAVNASTFQGTADFIRDNPAFVENDTTVADVVCNKDTGGLKAFHSWSRGMFFIVSAGGHIEYWQPLYRSESPTQAFLVTVLWLYRKFKVLQQQGVSDENIQEAISSICLAYDNMCHVDSLRISKVDLPFPSPFNKAWKLISKVIDRLHLRNHVDPKCKILYDPDDKIPAAFNTMACEQTFIWASRFKKIMCAMPHIHQFFFLHRLVKHRNNYTEKCHRNCKVPVLPKVGKSHSIS